MVEDWRRDAATCWVINTCTVKNPSQTAMGNLIARGKESNKKMVIAGCVPQGDRRAKDLQGLSLLGKGSFSKLSMPKMFFDSENLLSHYLKSRDCSRRSQVAAGLESSKQNLSMPKVIVSAGVAFCYNMWHFMCQSEW